MTYRSEKYRKHVQTYPCMICGDHYTIPHHEPLGTAGMGIKAPDTHCLPLCVECHADRHKVGRETFWKEFYDTGQLYREMVRILTDFLEKENNYV